MHRIAFKMTLKPGFVAEYKKRHEALWPELRELLSRQGVYDYSIFFDEETHTLFAVQKNDGQGSQQLHTHAVVKRWWDYMADIMEVNPDNSPVSIPLQEVFHM